MAWVRNETFWPINLATLGTIAGKAVVPCLNGDLVNPETWPRLFALAACGDLTFALDVDMLAADGKPAAFHPDSLAVRLTEPGDPAPAPLAAPTPDTPQDEPAAAEAPPVPDDEPATETPPSPRAGTKSKG